MFQTGYLTIAGVDMGIYTLDYPNQEVKTSFTESLLLAIENIPLQVQPECGGGLAADPHTGLR